MLDVSLHGRHIGTLLKEPGTSVVSFVLEDDYMADRARPVLGQQFEDRTEHRVFRQARHPGRLPAFFANLLPEGALQAIVLSQRPEGDDASILAFVGEDLPGAVTVRPAEAGSPTAAAPAKTFDEPGLPTTPTGPEELRFSLAGVQLKFSAVRDPDQRFTLPFRGRNGGWILKFGSQRYPMLPENELQTMQWASRSGLVVPHNELVPVRSIGGLDPRFFDLGDNVFVIERYDRSPDGARIHQEDFAQVRGALPEQKYSGASYEGLARFVGDLCGQEDLVELLRRVVFAILSGNTDAHLKNWSLVYPDRRTARLSPAYDLVFVRYYLETDQLALPLAKEKNPAKIGWEHITRVERFLRQHGHDLPIVTTLRAFVVRCLDEWQTCKGACDPLYRERLDAHLAALPLARDQP